MSSIEPSRKTGEISWFSLQRMPKDVLVHILSFLPPSEVAKCGQLSKVFHAAVNEGILWKSLVASRYGKRIVKLFEPVVGDNLSWKEIYRYQYPLLTSLLPSALVFSRSNEEMKVDLSDPRRDLPRYWQPLVTY